MVKLVQQVLVCLKKEGTINLGFLDNRRRELVALGTALRSGNTNAIGSYVKNALDAGASKEDILNVMAFIVGDVKLFTTMQELLRILQYEDAKRASYISVIDDVREN